MSPLLRLVAERSRGPGLPALRSRRGRRRLEKRLCFGEGGGSVSPRSALRISLPPSGTWKRYGLSKSLRHRTEGRRAQGREDGEGEQLNEPEMTSVCLWKTQLRSDAVRDVVTGPRLLAGHAKESQLQDRAVLEQHCCPCFYAVYPFALLIIVFVSSFPFSSVSFPLSSPASFRLCFSLVSFPPFSFGVVDVLMCCGARLLAGVDNCFVFD